MNYFGVHMLRELKDCVRDDFRLARPVYVGSGAADL